MNDILQVPAEQRDQNWENQFFQALMKTKLTVLTPDPQIGPDQWPYLFVQTDGPGQESISAIISWLSERGIGLVINPQKEYPDYVFSFGMLWSFKETGYFYLPTPTMKDGEVDFTNQKIKIAGDPTQQYLPPKVRSILKEFFRDQGLLKVRTLAMSVDGSHFDLCFSLESLGNPPDKEHAGIAEAIGWFLPPHYSIVLVSEKGLPAFFDL